ncbi:restriction endonuclease subunit S [Stenotrophomonas sp. CFBP 13718]|uniref:restriction endonuclease subunit S n=1 Tax=Stenotrophomonas sp. CFBP 13718 TaxID=2775304 RepID=UPI00177CDD5C|nr:restriction endonuclease subunit S [Stenotrophomonas sp. CFBP 13718]
MSSVSEDSRVVWREPLPKHWKAIALRRVASLKSGESISADSISLDGDYPVYGGNGVRGFTSTFTHEGHFALIGRQGALCGNVHEVEGRLWASEHAVVVSPTTDLDVRWLCHVLRTMDLNRYSTAAAQPGISVDAVSSLKLPYPPTQEQKRIANFLDRQVGRIDALVTKKTRFIDLLREKHQALITHAVTKGMDRGAPMKDSGVEWLGEAPAHWKAHRLANVFQEVTRTGHPDLPVLSISIHDGISDDELDDAERNRKVTLIEDRTKYKKVVPGDLAYNMMRAWQGAFGAVGVAGQVSPAYVVAAPKIPMNTSYVELLLRTPMAIEEMRRFSRGIADFRSRLYWENFRNIRICLPPREEQDHILSTLTARTTRIDTLITKTERSIELLREHRTALITAAVTGKIDLRPAA